jgi:sulfatase maturation enzyme AslB (radical SAM superfamily)
MGYLLAAKELLKYRFRLIIPYIEKARLILSRRPRNMDEEISCLWSILINYSCTTDCSYCVQNYSFKNGRRDSPLKGKLFPKDWLSLNDIADRPDTIVITGGEPFLYKELADVIAGFSGFRQVWVVTNLTLDVTEVINKLRSITSHQILFHCSYHETGIDFDEFLSRAIFIKNAGLLGSVRIVDTDSAKTKKYIKDFAMHDIKIQSLFRVGMKDDEVLVMSHPEASNLSRKPPVLCRTKMVLFAPNGDVYNCHTKLYWGDTASSFGNLKTGFEIPDEYCICYDYGFCHPCQIGYMDIKPLDLNEAEKKKYRILPSNPPSGVVKSR